MIYYCGAAVKSFTRSLCNLCERKAFISPQISFRVPLAVIPAFRCDFMRFSKIIRNWVENILNHSLSLSPSLFFSRAAVGSDDTKSCIFGSHRQTWFPWISKSNARLSVSTSPKTHHDLYSMMHTKGFWITRKYYSRVIRKPLARIHVSESYYSANQNKRMIENENSRIVSKSTNIYIG